MGELSSVTEFNHQIHIDPRPRNGVTLLELLVVMAVLGILVSALVPTITHVRENAYASRCESNLKNLAHAVVNYANDNDGWMPVAGPYEVHSTLEDRYYERAAWVNWTRRESTASRGPWTAGAGWRQQRQPWRGDGMEDPQAGKMERPVWWGVRGRQSIEEGTLWPYLRRDINTFLCPKFRQRGVSGSTMPADPKAPAPMRSYVMNDFFYPMTGNDGKVGRPWHPRRMQWLESRNGVSPSRLLLFADLNPHQSHSGVQVSHSFWATRDTGAEALRRQSWDGVLTPRIQGGRATESIGILHRGRAQVVFVDGHVESFRFSARDPHPNAARWSDLVYKLCRGDL